MKKINTAVYDILGISTAAICLVHCILFPLIAVIPLGITENIWVDIIFGVVGLFVVLQILFSKTLKKIKILLTVSIVLIWISIVIHALFDMHSYLIFMGGFGMVLGHFMNYKRHKHKNKNFEDKNPKVVVNCR